MVFVVLVYPRVPNWMGTPVVAFMPILTVDPHVHIVLGGGTIRVAGTAHVAALVHLPDVAQHQPGSIVVRVCGDRAVGTLPLDL